MHASTVLAYQFAANLVIPSKICNLQRHMTSIVLSKIKWSLFPLSLPTRIQLQKHLRQSINQSCIFRVVQVIKSLQDPLEVGNNLPGVNDNVRERGLEQKSVQTQAEG